MDYQQRRQAFVALLAALVLSACQTPPPEPMSSGHLTRQPSVAATGDIPEPVRQTPFLPAPRPVAPTETYTVVVSEVPVKELLFAVARDADVNIDVHPAITGTVTLNAVEQTLEQILDRIARQIPLRYEQHDGSLAIVPDTPFLRTYRIDYVNVTRDSNGSISSTTLVGTELAQQGAGGNRSDATIQSVSNNRFWDTLGSALTEIVRPQEPSNAPDSSRVIVNPEAGVITVRATDAQHRDVQAYIDQVMTNAMRQVLIEATIVEIGLNDRYQAGIDWAVFTRTVGLLGAGVNVGTNLLGAFDASQTSGGVSGFVLDASNAPLDSPKRKVQASIQLLNEFGDTQVLSSPKVMTLNNQPAVLKVVDNEVYFSINIETNQNANTTNVTTESDVQTVAVGLVMSVTPQIGAGDQVSLTVRPSITRVREFVTDPAISIALAQAEAAGFDVSNITNQVPVVQTRESEAVMRVRSGQLAVLGGLMQDQFSRDDEAIPGLSEPQGFGELFKFRDRAQRKTELVVFLRPTVIHSPDVSTDLSGFSRLLPENLDRNTRSVSPLDAPYTGPVQ